MSREWRGRAVVVLVIAVTTLVLLVSGPGSTSARAGQAREPDRQTTGPSTVTIHDDRGDAWRRPLDVVQARFTNGPDGVEVAVRLANVRVGARTQVDVRMETLRRHEVYTLSTRHAHGRAASVELVGDTGLYLDCDLRSRWRAQRDVIRLSFPRTCLGAPAALRVVVLTAWVADEMGDASDWTDEVRVAQGQ